ncbi:MAG TPA: biotin--[acetyl-CoA-carboxylase] ligase [Acidimicrobiales bacterium]|nr:biotin--[acetyl-CoA-carboxylase] ligase [Acidimicrobiales bacterium]
MAGERASERRGQPSAGAAGVTPGTATGDAQADTAGRGPGPGSGPGAGPDSGPVDAAETGTDGLAAGGPVASPPTAVAGDDALAGTGSTRGRWADDVRAAVAGTRFSDVRWTPETGSTNADVLALARDGAGEGIVVVADHQTAGRGRRSRTWVAPPGGSLLVSVLLRPPAPVAGATTMAAAVAMADAVDEVAAAFGRGRAAGDASRAGVDAGAVSGPGGAVGGEVRLKWPNDLVVGDRKLGGILAEADWPAGAIISGGWRPPPDHARVVVVVGIGLNVAWPGELPPELAEVADTAVSFDRLLGPPAGSAGSEPGTAAAGAGVTPGGPRAVWSDDVRAALLTAFLRRLHVHYGELVASRSAAAVTAAWRARSATLGRRVRVDLGADDVVGTAVDVNAEGHLVVETDEGGRRTLAVGDVVHLRRA